MVGLQAIEGAHAVALFGAVVGQLRVEGGVALGNERPLTGGLQALCGVGADGLE